MKKSSLLIVFPLILAMGASAQMGMNEPRSVDTIVSEIEKQQNASTMRQVAIDKVPPQLLEELGDSVMGVIIGNSDAHDRMDKMLGGDGSSQLNAFHIDLGQQYLQNGGYNGVTMGGPWGMGRFGMMWGSSGLQAIGGQKTLEGTLGLANGTPSIKSGQTVYLLDFPDFYYYAYNDGIKEGARLKLEGYESSKATAGSPGYFSVSKATINGKVYDFTGFQRRSMGASGGGMMTGGGYK